MWKSFIHYDFKSYVSGGRCACSLLYICQEGYTTSVGYRYRTGWKGNRHLKVASRAQHAGACFAGAYACLRFWLTMSLFIVGLVWVTSNTGLSKSQCQQYSDL